MRSKMLAIASTVFASILILTACAPAEDQATESRGFVATEVIPEGQEIIPDGAVDMEYVMARDAALITISERYGEQAPRSGLPWAVEDVTPDGQGSPVFQYSAEDWVVTVSCMVTIPDGCTFDVLVINQATGFRWEGEVDTRGEVTEKPAREPIKASEWVLAARDAALGYLADQFGDQALHWV